MPFRVTVRHGPAVRRSSAPTLEAALDLVEEAARDAARERAGSVDLRFRRFEPGERVVARVELAGPQRLAPSVRAGVDVHGDGSMLAHVGRARRAPVPEGDRESALGALRRTLLNLDGDTFATG